MKSSLLRRFRSLGIAAAVTAIAPVSAATGTAPAAAAASVPRPDHVVIVMMENKNYDAIIGRPDEAPYLNDLASRGAVFSNSYAVAHPSQPNYIALFSGSTQGVDSDDCPQSFTGVPNLGADLIAAGGGFAGYSESMSADGDTGCGSDFSLGYVRKHNPWVDFGNVPAASNRTFAAFPSDYSQLPSVSFVIPNLCHDMHYCSRDTGDAWIRDHLGAYAQWAAGHNSLLLVTWDEDGSILGLGGDGNKIPTILYGAHVAPGVYAEHVDHYRVLRTIEDMFGLPHEGQSAGTTPITDVWN